MAESLKEQIYDEQINPLMDKILRICREHKIAFIADFALGGDLKCTSAMLSDDHEPTQAQLQAWALLKPQTAFAMAETIETLPDGSKKITLQRIS